MFYNGRSYYGNDDRFFPFFFPVGALLLGGLGGAAIASAARPRPYFIPQPYPVTTYGPAPYPNTYNQYSAYNYY